MSLESFERDFDLVYVLFRSGVTVGDFTFGIKIKYVAQYSSV